MTDATPKSNRALTVFLPIVVVTLGGAASVGLGRGIQRAREERLIADVTPHPSLTREDRLRIATGIQETMGALIARPDFNREMSRALHRPVNTPADARAAGKELSARGLSRLSAAQLNEVYTIRLALAERSPAVCVALWNGRIADGEVMAALARLPHAQMLQWFRLSQAGMEAAMRPDFTVPPEDADAVQTVVQRAQESVAPAERPRFQRTIDAAENAAPLEGCATMLDILRTARQVDPALRERFYRSMARP
jgi:hypothetical protein